ncbi:MAG: S-layer homology domain-containing protein [Oscillospiraceae bacterium]|nr:S-layer homology domain-containing protein [Oscillospiraceae bacterium]
MVGKRKRVLSILLALLMVLSVFPVAAMATNDAAEPTDLIDLLDAESIVEAAEEVAEVELQGIAPLLSPVPGNVFNFQILHTNDLHGIFGNWRYTHNVQSTGLATLYNRIETERAAALPATDWQHTAGATWRDRTLLVDVGDTIQGNLSGPFHTTVWDDHPGNVAQMCPMIYAMEVLGYDVFTLGNHEFDFGFPRLYRALGWDPATRAPEAGRLPGHYFSGSVLAGNVRDHNNEGVFDAYHIQDFTAQGGPRVAIIGMTRQQGAQYNFGWFSAMNYHATATTTQTAETIALLESAAWQAANGGPVDLYIGVMHMGQAEARNVLATPVPGHGGRLVRDYIVGFMGGHAHSTTEGVLGTGTGGGVRFSEAGNRANRLGRMRFTAVYSATDGWTVDRTNGVQGQFAGGTLNVGNSPANNDFLTRPMIQAAHGFAMDHALAPIGTITGPAFTPTTRGANLLQEDNALWRAVQNGFQYFGNTAIRHSDDPDLVAIRERTDGGPTEIGVVMDGPLAATRNINAGGAPGVTVPIFVSCAYAVYEFDNNTLVIVELTGHQLRLWLEHSYVHVATNTTNLFPQISANNSWRLMTGYGMPHTVDMTQPIWERITLLNDDGTPMTDEQLNAPLLAVANSHTTGNRAFVPATGATSGAEWNLQQRMLALPAHQTMGGAGGEAGLPHFHSHNASGVLFVEDDAGNLVDYFPNAFGATGLLIDYIRSVMPGGYFNNIINTFEPNFRFITAAPDEVVVAKATEIVNANIGVSIANATMTNVRAQLNPQILPLWDLYVDNAARDAADYTTASWAVFATAMEVAAEVILDSGRVGNIVDVAARATAAVDALTPATAGLQPATIPQPQRIDILTFADFHGRLEADPMFPADPGAARFVAFTEWVRAQNDNPDNVMVIPGGDDFHGGPLSNLFRGEPTLDMMHFLGVEYMAFGNHEFSFGEATARELGRPNGGVTFLAADLFYGATHPDAVADPALVGTRPDFVQPYTIVEFEDGDITIGLVGIMNPHMPTLVAGGMEGWDFRSPVPRWPAGLPVAEGPTLPNPAHTQAIADIIEELRDVHEVNAVVAVTHIGGGPRYYPIMDFLVDNLDFDAVVGGHEHGRWSREHNGVPIVVAGWHGRNLGRISLEFDGDGELVDATGWMSPEGAIAAFPDHADFDDFSSYYDGMNAILDKWENDPLAIATFGDIGPYGVYIGDSIAYRNFWVTRVFHDFIVNWSYENHDAADGEWVNDWITVTNGGGWRANNQWPRDADDIVTGRDLIGTMPFDDAILWIEMYGEDLLKLLAHGGVNTGLHRVGDNWYITATGERVMDDQSTIHNVAVRGFMYSGFGASGGDGFPLPGNMQGTALGMHFHGHPRVITADGSDLRHNDMIAQTPESAAWAGLGAVMIRDMLIESTRMRYDTPATEWQSTLTLTTDGDGTAAITFPFAPENRTSAPVIHPQWVTVEATLDTAAPAGYEFLGWFNGNTRVSTNAVFSFAVTADTTLQARFGEPVNFDIVNPYEGVDWDAFGQYRAAMHVHTTRSDGGNFRDTVLDHFNKGFDILAIADHDVVFEGDWADGGLHALTPAERDAILDGSFAGPFPGAFNDGDLWRPQDNGMIPLPFTNEQSRHQHILTFWADVVRDQLTTQDEVLGAVAEAGGLAILAHPGRYTGGMHGGAPGLAASRNPAIIARYIELFDRFATVSGERSLLGMEMFNRLDNETRMDRVLWDEMLTRLMPYNMPIWGFSNDDSHNLNEIGYNWNVFPLETLHADNVREAMEDGAFYMVTRMNRGLGPTDTAINTTVADGMPNPLPNGGRADTLFLLEQPTPGITNIEVDGNVITIEGADYDRIEWVTGGNATGGGTIIHTGPTFDVTAHWADINGNYVRAQLVSTTGMALTQPFGIVESDEEFLTRPANDAAEIVTPQAVRVRSGAEATVDGLRLPNQVTVETARGWHVLADVTWTMPTSAQYDPAITNADQVFTLTGTVTLPADVTNGRDIPLTVTIQVTVRAYETIVYTTIAQAHALPHDTDVIIRGFVTGFYEQSPGADHAFYLRDGDGAQDAIHVRLLGAAPIVPGGRSFVGQYVEIEGVRRDMIGTGFAGIVGIEVTNSFLDIIPHGTERPEEWPEISTTPSAVSLSDLRRLELLDGPPLVTRANYRSQLVSIERALVMGSAHPQGQTGPAMPFSNWILADADYYLETGNLRPLVLDFETGEPIAAITNNPNTFLGGTSFALNFSGDYEGAGMDRPMDVQTGPVWVTIPAANIHWWQGRSEVQIRLADPLVWDDIIIAPQPRFVDVGFEHWGWQFVQDAYDNGFMTGYSATHFNPYGRLTRAQAAQIILNKAGVGAQPFPPTAPFPDVPATAWYAPAIAWVSENEIMIGHANGFFGPGELLTREQFAVTLRRFAEFQGLDITSPPEGGAQWPFPDDASISWWSREALRWANYHSVILGDSGGMLRPTGTAQRVEAAVMVVRFYDNVPVATP